MTKEVKFQIFTWVLAAISLFGVILNIFKLKECFYLWALTNACWTLVDFKKKIYAQAALFFTYFVLAIIGIFTWG